MAITAGITATWRNTVITTKAISVPDVTSATARTSRVIDTTNGDSVHEGTIAITRRHIIDLTLARHSIGIMPQILPITVAGHGHPIGNHAIISDPDMDLDHDLTETTASPIIDSLTVTPGPADILTETDHAELGTAPAVHIITGTQAITRCTVVWLGENHPTDQKREATPHRADARNRNGTKQTANAPNIIDLVRTTSTTVTIDAAAPVARIIPIVLATPADATGQPTDTTPAPAIALRKAEDLTKPPTAHPIVAQRKRL